MYIYLEGEETLAYVRKAAFDVGFRGHAPLNLG
jgi:hypothetical protein